MAKRTKVRPTTLRAAHEVMVACRPAPDAPLEAWLAYHQDGQNLYNEVADADRFHHHEALYWANREKESAEKIASRLAGGRPTNQEESPTV
jgi:hypothetical protein